jgi:CDP-glucose 4,6-dehydratase
LTVALITGARGFIGGWLAKALLDRGDRVVAYDRRRTSDRPSVIQMLGIDGELVQVEADVTDPLQFRGALDANRIETVFHLAADPIVGYVAASPARGFESNVRGTWTVLDACRFGEIERVVVASSDKAYGAHDELPYREDFALQPTAPYEASKAAADLIARSYWHSYGLPVAVTRFANVYGGGDLNFSRIVPEAVSAALAGRAPVLRSDGSPERDFLYVEDAAAAYIAIADALDRDEVRGEAFNCGAGRPYAVREVVELIVRLAGTGVDPEIRGTGNPAGEIDRQYLDPAKLRDLVGFEPAFDLERGLERTIDWYREHPEARAPQPA